MTDVQSRRLQAAALCRSEGPSQSSPTKFARDLQERLGILALLVLPAPFRICKLQIPLAARETDPASGHHLESITYMAWTRLSTDRSFLAFQVTYLFSITYWQLTHASRKKAGVARYLLVSTTFKITYLVTEKLDRCSRTTYLHI
jgi:hypothetical protein